MTDQTCQKWFERFRAGDFSLDNAPQSGRPVEVDNDQIEMWEIADILKISKSIKLLVKMKNVSFILRKKLNGLLGQPNGIEATKSFLEMYFLMFKAHSSDA